MSRRSIIKSNSYLERKIMSTLMKQIGLALVTFTIYSFLFSWQVAATLCIGIGFHEYSHLWAARHLGLSTKGFFLIPFIGGLALITQTPKSRSEQAFIYIMGPVGGGLLAFITAGVYLITGLPVLGAAALWMVYINLFNLIPVSILDGGQLMNTITYSLNRTVGLVCQVVSTALAIVVLFKYSPFVAFFIAFMGVPALIKEYKNWDNYRHDRVKLVDYDYLNPPRKQSKQNMAFTIAAWAGTAGVLIFLMVYLQTTCQIHLGDLYVR